METFKDFLNESKDNDTRKKLVEFFINTKDITVEKVKKILDENKISEMEIYSILVDFFQAGRYYKSKKKPDIPKDKLEAGIKVEMEHTPSRLIAEKIAKDHLTERSDYYEELKKNNL